MAFQHWQIQMDSWCFELNHLVVPIPSPSTQIHDDCHDHNTIQFDQLVRL